MPHPEGLADPFPPKLDTAIAATFGHMSLVKLDNVPIVSMTVQGFIGRTDERTQVQIVFRPHDWEGCMAQYLEMVERSPEWDG